MFDTTIHNSYKAYASEEWKDTANFSRTDLTVLTQLSAPAFHAIGELKFSKERCGGFVDRSEELGASSRRVTQIGFVCFGL